MSQEKAQLIAPLGNMTVPGVTATGVITATSFEGNIAGSATSIKQGSSISAGVVTASSFAGNLTGNIQRLADSGPNINVGVVTATSFSGNLTGSVTDLTSAPAITVGVVTATTLKGPVTGNITGNVSGHAGGLGVSYNGGWPGAGTSQISAGVMTATTFYGDGSNLDGVSSGPVSQQAVTANSGTTAIDLSNGNLIYMTQSADTTVSFANSENGNVYIIRTKDDSATARTITWPTGIGWSGGDAPTLVNNPRATDAQIFLLTTRDEGVTWYGKEVMRSDPQTHEMFVSGRNYYGEFGLNVGEGPGSPRSSPTQVGTEGTWAKSMVAHHGATTWGGVKTDGTAWFSGLNNQGQYTIDGAAWTASYRSSPVQMGTDTNWSYITSNPSQFMMATKTDNTLWAWAAGSQGQLAQNNRTTYSSPMQIPGSWSADRGKMKIGQGQASVIKTDGTLWSWGYNKKGVLGLNDDIGGYFSSPVQVGTDTTWKHVLAGYNSTNAIKTDGTLWVWGKNDVGQLGQNSGDGSGTGGNGFSSPTQIPGTTWSWASGAEENMMAVKTDGTLWVWGHNSQGALGLNQAHGTKISSPTQVGTDTNWSSQEFSSISNYGMTALKTDGTAWVWGQNDYGQLGQNGAVSQSSPVQIPGTDWTRIDGNPYYAQCLLKAV